MASSKRSTMRDSILLKVPSEGALAGENMIGAKPGRHRHHLFQAQPEERRTCEQDKSEGDLRDDEAVAKTLRGTTDRARCAIPIAARSARWLPRLNQAIGTAMTTPRITAPTRPTKGEPAIERDLRAERQTVRAEHLEQVSSPCAQRGRRAIPQSR